MSRMNFGHDPDANDGEVLWDCFHQSLQANKKGYNRKKRILSIIAENFLIKL
ncbi:21313_t:CDS:2 [Entrophospora sp. SA101]|nr:21313_t:CDS:2 [Entrophospora sp. SA101]